MLEDSDDKVRRNLVVASTLVIAAGWLGLPVHSLLDHFAGLTAAEAQTSAMRVWTLIGAILAYLTFRYRFADDTRRCWRRTRLAYTLRLQANVRAVLRREVLLFNRQGRESPMLADDLSPVRRKWNADHRARIGQGFRDEATRIAIDHVNFAKGAGTTSGAMFLKLSNPDAAVPTRVISAFSFRLPLGQRIKQNLLAALGVVLYSRSSTEFFVPITAAIAAGGITIWRLATLVDWPMLRALTSLRLFS